MSLREAARQIITDSVFEAADKDHRYNYHKLHVYRNGTVSWSEHVNSSSDFIDSAAKHFTAVRSVTTRGTGSHNCNCEFCNSVYSEQDEQLAQENGQEYDKSAKYATVEDAIIDAISESDVDALREDMLNELDRIPVGYFTDEEEVAVACGQGQN
jgi:hypothetical protein